IYNRGAIVSEGDISTSGYGNMSFGFHNIGLIQTKSSFLIEGDDFLNDGYIEVDGRLSFKGDVMNNSGEVQVTDKANFRFNTLKNTGDFFVYGSSLSELPVTLNHMAYLGGDVLVMNGDFLDNSGKLYAKNALVDVDQFIQSGMFLIDNNAELKLNFSGDFSGISSVGKTFDLSVGEAFNLAGDVYASTLNMIVENVNIVSDGQIFASLRVTANSKFNNDGVMIGDDFSFVAHDEFHNSGSVLASNIQINSPEFQNFSYINASDSLHISANSLYNNGAILGKGALFKSQDFINFNTIIFDDFITIDSGKLKNTSHGKLIAGNLFLDAKFFENYGKVMSTNLLWLDSTSIKNFSEHDLALGDFSKGLISEGNLVLDSDYIDNSNGLILGHDLLISANYDFINDQGHILDYGDNSLLTSNYFQNLSGRIESNGNLNLIGSVLNKDGFIYTFNDLSMGALNNTDGKVYSGVGDITIDSEDIFINDHAQLIAMNGDVLLNVNSISNINGFISASRNILIQLMNDFHHYSGDILAGQSINIYAKDISFSKDLMTNSYLGLVSRENIVVSSNSVLYSDHLDIQAENDLINNGVIESNVLTTISFGSVFENYGNVRSYGGLYLMSDGEVDSKRITNFSEIISGGPLFFDLDGLSMINDGSIISNSGLRLRLFDINNSGLILSMSDAEYNIQNSLINSGDLLSNGLVSFHNNESSMVLMKNFSGLIESVGDMKIKSETLENLADYRILDLYNDQIPSYDYFGANETIYKTKSKLHPVYPEKYLTLYHSQDLIYHRPATIQSRGEIHIDSKNIDNVASSIVSGTNLLIMNDADVHNYSVPLNYTQRTYYVEAVYQFTEQAPCQKNTWTCWGSSTDKYWYKDHIRFYDESYTKVGASAQISAQGLLSLDGDYSAHSVAISHGSDSKLHIDGADPVESVSFSNIESELQSKRNLTIDSTSSVLDTINHFKESKRLNEDLLANNRLELSDSANDFVNIEEVDFRQIINMMKKKNSVGTYGLSLDKNSESSGVRINAPVLTHGILPVASILIKNRYPRTRMESDPSRSVYIEHPGFQSKQDLIQSDYFYTRINLLYPNAIPLGSEYIEQRFMEHFLDSTLGRRLLYEDVDSMLDQMNIWYANAARLADEFKVPLGNPLSKTIVANLSKDILWMEVVNMDGQEVIVPRLYLSKETKKNLSDSGNRAGLYADILLLNHGDVRLNSGGLKANVFMGEIESLNNDRFSLIDVGYIDLISKKNIVNNGRIESTHHLSLVSMSGDILNKSVIGLDYQGNEYMISKGQLASQGDIFLNANKIINDSS
ncbi:MAG: hypothetical protein VW397_08065, partial [Candidatus Margulisiibacteriota bacterium]